MTDPTSSRSTFDAFDATLAAADKEFLETRDPVHALTWISAACLFGRPVPRAIADWFGEAVAAYLSDRDAKLDDVMGLRQSGKAQPKRRALAVHQRQLALEGMQALRSMGATIEGAAVLMECMPPYFRQSTLIDRYRRSRLDEAARAAKAISLQRKDLDYVRSVLAKFPDDTEDVLAAKAEILQLYA